MARTVSASTGWLRSVRPLITANVEDESLIDAYIEEQTVFLLAGLRAPERR